MEMSARLRVMKGERRKWFRGSLRFLRRSMLMKRRIQIEVGTEVWNIMVTISHISSPWTQTLRTKNISKSSGATTVTVIKSENAKESRRSVVGLFRKFLSTIIAQQTNKLPTIATAIIIM